MARTQSTAGQILVNELLPEEMRDYQRTVNKKSLGSLLAEVAKNHPDRYREISFKLGQLGRIAAYRTGGQSFGLRHLRQAVSAKHARLDLQEKIDELLDRDDVDEKTLNDELIRLAGKVQATQQDEIFNESKAEDNPLAHQLEGAGRGNKMTLASMRGSDLLYQDYKGNIIPVPVMKSYSQGLTPLEYWAGTYGARRGVISVKKSTADTGFLGKQLAQIAHRLIVSADDEEGEPKTLRGLPVDVTDSDSEGALLAHPAGDYPRNTILTPKILRALENQGIKKILVRSPAVSGAPDGGLYAKDVGIREFNRLPVRHESVGLSSAQSLCLAEGTSVRMADGSCKSIQDIVAGDTVLGCSDQGILTPSKVLAVQQSGQKECIRAVFRRGTGTVGPVNQLEIVATPEHKLLTTIAIRTRKASAQRVEHFNPTAVRPLGYSIANYQDRFCAQLAVGFDDSACRYEPFALIAGVLTGDGTITGCTNTLNLSCYDRAMLEDMRGYMRHIGMEFREYSEGAYGVVDLDSKFMKCDESGNLYRNRLQFWLKQEGLFGKRSYEKELPKSIWYWDNPSVLQYIAGLVATDGYVSLTDSHHCVGFTSTSKALLDGVRAILAIRFGVYGSGLRSYFKPKPDSDETYRCCYAFTINGKDALARLSDLAIPGKKQETWERIVQSLKPKNDSTRCSLMTREPAGVHMTYDLYIAHPDHLFLLENGLIVSNSEPITQSALSEKHSGGVASGRQALSGFERINQLIQIPKTFKGGAAHSTVDGIVQSVEPAPAGGHFVSINGTKHYVAKGFNLSVKKGDKVEAGDVLSDGEPNPALITQYKGLGEGRRYFIDTFQKAMRESGLRTHRRNTEILSRGLINHVRMQDEYGQYAPDDVVPYSTLEHNYEPRPGFRAVSPSEAVGKYLERPYLHYTIGTKIRPSMLENMREFGIRSVDVHDDPPPFEPEMVRGMSNLQHDPDWMVRMFGSGLKTSLLRAVHRGGTSDEAGTSFVPSRARSVDFGRVGLVQTPRPPKPTSLDR